MERDVRAPHHGAAAESAAPLGQGVPAVTTVLPSLPPLLPLRCLADKARSSSHPCPHLTSDSPFLLLAWVPCARQISFLVYDKDKFSSNDPMGVVRLDILEIIEYDAAHGVWREEDYQIKPCEGCRHPTGTLRIKSTVQVHRRANATRVAGVDPTLRQAMNEAQDRG